MWSESTWTWCVNLLREVSIFRRLWNRAMTHRVPCLQALEFQMQQGLAGSHRDDVYLVARGAQHMYGPPMQARGCVIQLLL